MKLKQLTWKLLFLPLIVLLGSCEKSEYFKSASTIKEQLKGDWNLILIPRTNSPEVWTFNDGRLVHLIQLSTGASYDTASYSIKTSWNKVEMKIDGFTNAKFLGLDQLNGKWEIVRLDNDFLVMATDHDGTTGILEREFQKKK